MSPHLLHIIPDLDPRSGGTVSALEGLAIAQTWLGLRVSILTGVHPETDRRVIERLKIGGVSVVEVPVHGRIGSIRLLRHALKQSIGNADAVHIHAVWEEIQHQACVAARTLGIPYMISPHGMLDPWSLRQRGLKKRLYLALRLRAHLNAAAAIHCTTETESRLLAPLNIQAKKIVVPNGVDLTEFDDVSPESSPDGFLTRFPRAAGKPLFLFLSRLHPKKGLDLLLPAFAQCAARDAILAIAGPGDNEYIDHLRSEARRLAIEARVIFTGMLHGAERVAALRAADLFVLPSYQENFGISVIESLAAATPVIISDQVNLAESIRDAGVGEVISPNAAALAEAMERWLANGARRESAGKSGRAFAAQFAFDAVAGQWQDVWGELWADRARDALRSIERIEVSHR